MTTADAGLWNRPAYVPSAKVFHNIDRAQFVYAEHRVSEAEFKRRHQVMREFMDRNGLDCLVIAGGSDVWNRGFTNMRWVTDALACELSHYEYVVFPRQGEITILTFPMYAFDPGRRARTFVEDVRGIFEFGLALVSIIKEKGYSKGKIGIVEIASEIGIPHKHWKAMRQGLPKAKLEYVTKQWWTEVRLIKSAEEIRFIERAAEIGDKMMEAVANNIREGMTEADIFAVMDSAMIRAGGEIPTMVLAVSFPMTVPSATIVRETPQIRTLEKGDIILTEIAPRYPDGSECQTGRTFILGEPTDEYAEMIEVMWPTYNRVVDQLRPGKTGQDLKTAVEPTLQAGYLMDAPLVHSDLGGGVDAEPQVMTVNGLTLAQSNFAFQPNMVVTPEMYITKPNAGKGVYTLDTWAITEGAPRCLHKYPRKIVFL